MPIYDFKLPPDSQGNSRFYLQTVGPIITVEISAPDSLIQVLQQTGRVIPTPITGFGILDTGAYTTCVNKSILQSLGGQPVGTRPVTTPGFHGNMDVYPAKIKFPRTTIDRSYDEALGINDLQMSFRGRSIIALIGRDVLSDCILIYNGKTGIYTLTH